MRPDLADILACPVDKGALTLAVKEAGDGGEVVEGTLACVSCGAAYAVRSGVPDLLPPGYSS